MALYEYECPKCKKRVIQEEVMEEHSYKNGPKCECGTKTKQLFHFPMTKFNYSDPYK